MPKQSLLDLTQDILSDGSGDYVNSIDDTEESEQIARIIRTAYWDIIEENHSKFPNLKALVQLDSASSLAKPTHMQLNADVYTVHFLRYNVRKLTDTKEVYKEIEYRVPSEFLDILNSRDSAATNVQIVADDSGAELLIKNDKAPEYYTSFDDTTFVFDSWDEEVENTLQTSKTQMYVSQIPVWVHEDAHIPDLPPQAFSLLLSESKSVYWNAIKQLPNQKEEQKASRQRRTLQQHKHQIKKAVTPKRFGRRAKK